MNKPRSPRPRLVCSTVRFWQAMSGPAPGQTRLAARHLAGCAECRAFFAGDEGFEQLLRRDADRLRSGFADTGLERRILRAVREAGAGPAERAPSPDISPVWGRALLASAGVAAALAFVFWPRQPAPGPETPVNVATKAEAGAHAPRVAAAEAGEWWQELRARRPGFAWAGKNPLEQEIDSVRTDARAVIGFLALNFLPTRPAPEPPPSQG